MVLDPAPELMTARLRLRGLLLEDADALFRIYGDPDSVRYVGRAPFQSVEQMREKLRLDLQETRRGEALRWTVTARADDEAIGLVGLFDWAHEHGGAELGYVLLRSRWGEGLVGELLPPVIELGFERMRLNRIEARVEPANAASVRLLERNGFRREGLLREKTRNGDGAFVDMAIYGRLRSDPLVSRSP